MTKLDDDSFLVDEYSFATLLADWPVRARATLDHVHANYGPQQGHEILAEIGFYERLLELYSSGDVLSVQESPIPNDVVLRSTLEAIDTASCVVTNPKRGIGIGEMTIGLLRRPPLRRVYACCATMYRRLRSDTKQAQLSPVVTRFCTGTETIGVWQPVMQPAAFQASMPGPSYPFHDASTPVSSLN